ncbi:HNH endonuclease [Ancylobacter sp.]|uniref:HNH endonuclease n=1 Tax=Ancylobacter sp. TaxID=1872567 RepID=UPI003BADA171
MVRPYGVIQMRGLKATPGGRCHYCHRMTAPSDWQADDPGLVCTRDHITPASRGGIETVIACRRCNNVRGDAPYEMFVWWMQHVNDDKNASAMRREFQRFVYEMAVIGFRERTGYDGDTAEPWGEFLKLSRR